MEKITELLNNFSLEKYIPKLDTLMGWIQWLVSLAVRLGPICILVLGIIYFLIPPKEANRKAGFRTYFGMGSVQAWRFTQRLAGWLFTAAGLVMTIVMFAISVSFPYMQLTDLTWRAASCLVVELAASVLLILIVNVSAMYHFDRKGKHRRKKRR